MRTSGVLLHISSLPSRYGIGTLGRAAHEFVDALAEAGQTWWQVLPVGPTGYGDSPYQSVSTFAGNPYFIDLELLCEEGLLFEVECSEVFWGADERTVDYSAIYNGREGLLRRAALRARSAGIIREFEEFRAENSAWLDDYALFMAIKSSLGGISLAQWPAPLRLRDAAALGKARSELAEDIRFYEFCQFLFSRQWRALREHAAERGIKIIGDLPIYVPEDSADVWAHPELFLLDEERRPIAVAGCPPDYFSATGQLWGNPLYRWDRHAADGFEWWCARLEHALKLADTVRIDHFRGLADYWSIPYGDDTAIGGHWEPGPGKAFTDTLRARFGEGRIIAEDLGLLSDEAIELQEYSGFPGMKVLQFAFEGEGESTYLPHNHIKNCVVYTGTHDNDTSAGSLALMNESDRALMSDYLGLGGREPSADDMVRAALMSVADTAIVPAQDLLGLGSEARMNTPGTLGENWAWRLLKGEMAAGCPALERLARYTKISGRKAK